MNALMPPALYQIHNLRTVGVDPHQFAVLHLKHTVHISTHPQIMGDHDSSPALLMDQPGKTAQRLVSFTGSPEVINRVKSGALWLNAMCLLVSIISP